MFPAQKSTKSKGFTLLELLVVVLLISIFVTFASVNWGVFAKKDSESFLERFSMEVGLLREEAISAYQNKVIQFDVTNNTMSTGVIDAVNGFKVSRRLDIPDGYVIRDVVVNGVKTIRGAGTMNFYPSALVDRAIIHFETRTQYYSFIIQPLTAKVEARDAYVEEISLTERNNTP
jgi:prepilin-type N-terminal cleavage/methylation domain-containing protein